ATTRSLYAALRDLPCTTVAIVPDSYRPGMPGVRVTLDEAAAGRTTLDLIRQLQDGTPSIHVDNSRVGQRHIGFAPIALKAGDVAIIAERLRGLLARAT